MRAQAILFAIACACVALGQTPAEQSMDRVLYFNHTDTVQGIHEIATVIGGVADLQQASIDEVHRTLAVHGTAAQIGLAEWLFNLLDQPPDRSPTGRQSQGLVVREYRMPGGSDDVVRVIYPTYTATVQELQEVATLVRSTVDIRRMFTYNEPRAVAFRGTADQMALAEWLFNELDKPANGPASSAREYRLPGSGDDMVRVFHLQNVATVQEFQEVAVVVRSIGDIRRLFTYNGPKVVAARGTSDQMALAGWLFDELDKPTSGTKTAREYRIPGSNEGFVRVDYLPDVTTVARFQEIVNSVRAAANIRRAFTYNTPRAIVFRGTAEQVALADRLIKEHDTP